MRALRWGVAAFGILHQVSGADLSRAPLHDLLHSLPTPAAMYEWDNSSALQDLQETSDGMTLLRVIDARPTPKPYAWSRAEILRLPSRVPEWYLERGYGSGRLLKCLFRAGVLPHAARGGAWRTIPDAAKLCLRCKQLANESMEHLLLFCDGTIDIARTLHDRVQAAIHRFPANCDRHCPPGSVQRQ